MALVKKQGALPEADGEAVVGVQHPTRQDEMGFLRGSDHLGLLADVRRLPHGVAAITDVSVGTVAVEIVPAGDARRVSVSIENPSDQRVYVGSVAGGRGPIVGKKPWIDPGDSMMDDVSVNDWVGLVETGTVQVTAIVTTLPLLWDGVD